MRPPATQLSIAFTCTLCAVACAAATQDAVPDGTLRVATFNAGLAPGDIDYAAERVEPVAQALAGLDADVVCLNEVWHQNDWDAITAATAATLPHAVHRAPDAECAVCSPVELDPLGTCVAAACADAVDEALVMCALAQCGADVQTLSGGCAGCLVGSATGGRSFTEVRDSCLGAADGSAPSYLYDCGYDTGILSALDVIESETLVLDSYLVHASVDYARVSTELGPADVFCTHLASSVSEIEYRGAFGDWDGEHAHQIAQLLDFIEEKTAEGGIALLLGDLNTSPGVQATELPAAREADYARLLDAGLTNPYLAQDDVACLSCEDNTLRPGKRAYIDDHILVRGYAGPTQAERIFDAPVSIDVDGSAVETNLSDHYGLALVLGTP